MKQNLPDEPKEFLDWSWEEIEPFFISLQDYPLNHETVENWLGEWSRLSGLIYERYQRHFVAITKHTNDQKAKEDYERFLDEIFGQAEAAEQKLKEKLLSSGLEPGGFEIPLRNIRAEAEIFHAENLPLLAEELKLSAEYDQILGEQTVEWQGEEKTLAQLLAVLQDPDRSVRERSWKLSAERWLRDRQPISCLWIKLLENRMQLAKNAGQPNYRDFRWKKLLRFDYSADDCIQFHQAIEEVVVPAASELYEMRKKELGLETLRPWDLYVDPAAREPLKPYESVEELEQGAARIFQRVDPQLGEYFEVMRREGLLDLENRKNKTSGGYCTDFPVSGRAFILMNSVGLHEDVQTLLHEGGHAFHVFESNDLPYFQQKRVGNEFAEVASMAMELLAAPYLTREQGGFYTPKDAARVRIQYLEEVICFWPYMAVVDAFQHWVYLNPLQAADPSSCDKKWGELTDRFMPGIDWSGYEEERVTGWQRKGHIFQDPFYYVEYGLALLGAFQVWNNALKDQSAAVAAYRKGLALGGTVPLPQLFEAAGARFAFDPGTLRHAVELGMKTIVELKLATDGHR